MDVRINGSLLNEPNLSRMVSFTDLMSDLNRLIGLRKEIITEVRADGREIISWDITELNLSSIASLDISTLPARDYAIASLGDLGDYTGEMLSVIRNIETICKKEGYAQIREKLLEGLTYILTVIETSSKLLDLNMPGAHYDARSGSQMLVELVSLKNRISASADFAGARKDLSELEYTLVDWLKFLELLLQRYSDQQSEIGESSEIGQEARSKAQQLGKLHTDISSVVEDMYAGKIAKSMDLFQTHIVVLQECLSYLERLRNLGRISYDTLTADGQNLSGKIPHITGVLKELSDSIRIGDSVLMRDLLEYEVLPFIAFIRQIYDQIALKVEKG